MIRRSATAAALLSIAGAVPAAAQQPGDVAPTTLVLANVAVVDASAPAPRPGRTVVIRDGVITELVDAAAYDPPTGALVVDGTGRWLIPGLWDMHVHLGEAGESALGVLVAHGVTGVRDMGGHPKLVARWRREAAAGERVAPRIRMAGPIVENARWLAAVASIPIGARFLEGDPRVGIGSPASARAAVDSLAGSGVDFIKLRNSPEPATFAALLEAARGWGLRVAGHLPGAVGLPAAAAAGYGSIEHIDQLTIQLDPLAPDQRAAVLDTLAAAGLRFTPTLITETLRLVDDERRAAVVADTAGAHEPRNRYVSDDLFAFWRFNLELDAYDNERDWGAVINGGIAHLRALHEAGVPIMAGTDLGVPMVYPGSGLHDELQLLVAAAGLSPWEALRAATLEPAAWFGEADRRGTIAPGMAADLVLLGGNPLADIRATTAIEGVVLGGQWLPPARLDALMDAASR